MEQKKIVTIKGIDSALWNRARAEALKAGVNIGELINQAIKNTLDGGKK